MEFPINLSVFGTEINTHLVTEIAAFFVGFRFYVFKKKRIQDVFSWEQRMILLIAAALGALIFSRVLGALENVEAWKSSPDFWMYLYSSKTVVGGLLGGWLFVEIAKYFMKLKASSGDVMTFPILLGLFIGRIGCFSQGIEEMTYGNETDWLTGMDLGDGVIRHPLALYELVVLILIGVLLVVLQRKQKLSEGMQFKLMMFLYLLYRFIAEWMKPHFPLALGLTSIQIAILICYLLYLRTILYLIIKPKNTLYAI
ncbi:prolipoprotein diacylglyceryl transferase family protein [Fluviicola taffensis]|uniref:prolipoprotein diacylglyceryl transferase family protein n=1 Tax=Fluviicola taffensis TaxID=191579 RepID=UPI00313821AF